MPIQNLRPSGSERNYNSRTRPENIPPDLESYYRDEIYGKNPDKKGGYLDPKISASSTAISFDDYIQNRFWLDKNTSVFRYGLQGFVDGAIDGFKDTQYEDPTYLIFTLEMDTETSALFNSAQSFITKYGEYYEEIKAREVPYRLFTESITQMFKTRETGSGEYYKAHYINSISGFDKLFGRFVEDFDDSFIEIKMNEDVRMSAQFLSKTYNDFVWSYKNYRKIIPENLEYFDLYIKISEVRHFGTMRTLYMNPDEKIGYLSPEQWAKNLKKNISSMVYKLHECRFDFSEAKNHADEITTAGFGAGIPDNSEMDFKIFFKSVSRILNPTLILDNFRLDDFFNNLGINLNESISANDITDFQQEKKLYNPFPKQGDEDYLNKQNTNLKGGNTMPAIPPKSQTQSFSEKRSAIRRSDFLKNV